MAAIQRITPCLWFDTQAEEAAQFYTSIFPNGRIVALTRYSATGQEIHRQPEGAVMLQMNKLDIPTLLRAAG